MSQERTTIINALVGEFPILDRSALSAMPMDNLAGMALAVLDVEPEPTGNPFIDLHNEAHAAMGNVDMLIMKDAP